MLRRILHRIVFIRLRVDPRTQDYYERRIKEDKTRREIVRCLKRHAAREVFQLVKQLRERRAWLSQCRDRKRSPVA
ncbi:hypothetical protein [Streptomyces mirabilis]|uniref:hypothetical protein n=2 Tax=Streptomyces mirabilis TaxID=68239 RepID=UPI0033B63FD5